VKRFLVTLTLLASLVPHAALAANEAAGAQASDATLTGAIQDALPNDGSVFGIAIQGLSSGRTVLLNADASFPTASLYKLGVMYEFYRQKKLGLVSVNDVLTETEANHDTEAESLLGPPGTQVAAGTALQLMMTVSDNIAAEMLQDKLGRSRINSAFSGLGLNATRIHTFAPGDPLGPTGMPRTTAGDMLRFFNQLATGTAIDADSNHEMLNLLLGDQVNDRIPAQLPFGTPVAHKTGDLEGLLNDAGIVYGPVEPFVIVVLSKSIPDVGPPDSLAVGRANIARIARVAYDYFEAGAADGTSRAA
jgi:beta-lactamase class A